MLNLALRKQIHSTHTQGNKSHTCTYMELQNISLGFHVPNTKERFSSYNYVEHLKWRYSNLYKPRSRTYIGKNVKLAWNLKEKITKSWSQICVLEALFLGEERRGSLVAHGDGGRKVENVDFHGGRRNFVRLVKEMERREKMERKKMKMKWKWRNVTNEWVFGLNRWLVGWWVGKWGWWVVKKIFWW